MQDSDGISSQNFPKLQDQMTSLVNYTKHQFFSSSSKNGRRENSNLFYEANITLILNPDKDIIWKKNWPIFLMNIGAKRLKNYYQTESSSVQFSRSVVSDPLWSHGQHHARPHCPTPSPAVYSNSCPLSWWCHPNISSSVIPFSSHLYSFPASGSFQMSQFFTSGGQSIGVSTSTSVFPMNIQDWVPLG